MARLAHAYPRCVVAVAAALVSAPMIVRPTSTAPPTLRSDVTMTSSVTDALVDLGQGAEVASSLIGIHVDATLSLPFEATLAVLAAAQHPESSAGVLSYLVQRFVNPTVAEPIHAYPFDTELAVARLADLLPYPLGPGVDGPGLLLDGGTAFAEAFDSVLSRLGDPLPGYDAVHAVMTDTLLGGLVTAAHLAVRAPLNMAWHIANYVAYLPADVEATLESAIGQPGAVPGLVSHLLTGALSPDARVGLVGRLLDDAVDPFTWLPGPVGYASDADPGWAYGARDAVAGAVNGVLSHLPAPVTPAALPPGTGAVLGPRDDSVGKGPRHTEPASPTLVSASADKPDRVSRRPQPKNTDDTSPRRAHQNRTKTAASGDHASVSAPARDAHERSDKGK
jgi:hypothetical protein